MRTIKEVRQALSDKLESLRELKDQAEQADDIKRVESLKQEISVILTVKQDKKAKLTDLKRALGIEVKQGPTAKENRQARLSTWAQGGQDFQAAFKKGEHND